MKLIRLQIFCLLLCFTVINCHSKKTATEYLETAQTYLAIQAYSMAIENLTEALNQDPANPEAWNSRAYAYFLSGDYENAIADYTETLRLEPEMGVAWVYRSQSYKQIGEHEKAAADMESIKRLIQTQKENQIIQHK